MKNSLSSLGLLSLASAALAEEPSMDIEGGAAFETSVSAHLELRSEAGERIAYLVIEKASAPFRTELLQVISDGNSLNSLGEDGKIRFRIGCEQSGQLISESLSLSPSEQAALWASGSSRPLSVVLKFTAGPQWGHGSCSSHADDLDLVSQKSSEAGKLQG